MFVEFFTVFFGWIIFWNILTHLWFWKKKDIKGQTVLITGAAQGLGQQIAIDFAKQGCKIIGWDLRECKETAELVKQATGQEMKYHVVDVTNEDLIKKVAGEIEKESHVDILVNNAGIVSGQNLTDTPSSKIRLIFGVNVFGIFWTIKAFLPGMLKRNKGHIVNIASISGYAAPPKLVPYAASKAAVQRLDHTLRYELADLKSNVKTTQINPFYISTGMFTGAKGILWYDHLTPQYVSQHVIKAVQYGYEEVVLPKTMFPFLWMPYLFPTWFCDFIGRMLGLYETMDTFQGHGGATKKEK